MKAEHILIDMRACRGALEWVKGRTAKEAWDECDRGDWMLWFAARQGIDLKMLTLAKVRCARLVEHLMKDDRSIAALVAAEKFSNGEITREELDAAADAADAAYAAAYAYAAAEKFSNGEITREELDADAYADAAYAAYAAAYSYAAAYAYAAARNDLLLKCADICRETIPFNTLNIKEV